VEVVLAAERLREPLGVPPVVLEVEWHRLQR
jgi:hypothetical protein